MYLRIPALFSLAAMAAFAAASGPFHFSTGNPDGLAATASRPVGPAGVETETADDFVLSQTTLITHATFTGLLPIGVPLSSVNRVEIEFYHVFPADSGAPSGNVPTRANSPSDVEIGAATRDSANGSLTFTAIVLNASFTAANTVINGINKSPNQFTGGEGPATGQEVLFDVSFTTPIALLADHYFFRPEVGLVKGDFLWLSAPKPIVAPGTPFAADLQSWIRNSNLAPDWLRIGTDITHQGPFNAAFSLDGSLIDSFQISYAANLSVGDSFVDITNTGASGASLQSGTTATITGAICANIYAFTPDEQLVSCCSCPVTPGGLVSLSAKNDLASNTLTPAVPTALVVKVLATAPVAGSCNNSAAAVGSASLVNGLTSFSTTIHALPVASSFGVTETPFSSATLSAGERSRLGNLCNFILANGSGFGVCRTCRLGGLGAERQ